MRGSSKKRLEADVTLISPDERDRDEEDEDLLHRNAFSRLDQERFDWEGESRRITCEVTCRKLRKLIQKELNINSHQVSLMVRWLIERSKMQIGERLPAAVMQSHMGATVDRAVYHPQLRSALRDATKLGVMVPVPSSECGSVVRVLEQVGNRVWQAYEEAYREGQKKLLRGQREVQSMAMPTTLDSLVTITSLARDWAELRVKHLEAHPHLSPFRSGHDRAHIMILLEDFAGCDRSVLRQLFKTLVEAQFGQTWCRGVAFSIVLWASSETEMEADLLDHLYLTRFPFMPPATMLHNVLFAALIEPNMPFVLSAAMHNWILRHFADQSHSLSWLQHVLHALVFTYFSSQAGTWCLDTNGQNENALIALQTHCPSFSANQSNDRAQFWKTKVAQWTEYRKKRCTGFVVLWKLLHALLADKIKPVLEAYGEYLQKIEMQNHEEAYCQYLKGLVRDKMLGMSTHMAEQVFKAVSSVLDSEMEGASHADLTWLKRVHEGLHEDPPPPQSKPLVRTSSTDEVAHMDPKAMLLMKPSKSIHDRQTLRSSSHDKKKLLEAVAVAGSTNTERIIGAISRCISCLVKETLAFPSVSEYPLLHLCTYGSSVEQFEKSLLGDHRAKVLSELERPSWGCKCCSDVSALPLKRTKSSSNMNATVRSSTMEDMCIAFTYLSRNNQLNMDEWLTSFKNAVTTSDEAESTIQQRFVRAVRDLQWMGLVDKFGKDVRKLF